MYIMRNLKLFLSLLLALTLLYVGPAWPENTIGPTSQILCNKVANVAVGATGNTQIVAGIAGQSIFLCGWQVTNTAAAGTFSFVYGTGATCTSSTTLVTPQSITSTAPSAYNVAAAQMQAVPGTTLCVNPSAATIAVTIWYSQF